MKVTCKKTGKDMTLKIIESIEKRLISQGHKLYKVYYTRDENGKLIKHKIQTKYDQYWII